MPRPKQQRIRVYQRLYCWPKDYERAVDRANKLRKDIKGFIEYLLDVEELHQDETHKDMEKLNRDKYYNEMKALLRKTNPEKYKEMFNLKEAKL